MTKHEALIAMYNGEKVQHRYFGKEEWMTMEDRWTIVFEDGVKVSTIEFFSVRNTWQWDDGYTLLTESTIKK